VYVLRVSDPDHVDQLCDFLRRVRVDVATLPDGTVSAAIAGAPTPLYEVSELSGIGRETAAGDYAIVIIRKIVSGKVQTIFVVKDIRRGANTSGLARGYHISAIADLNGDGRMEIALYSAYYEGSSADIFDLNGTKLTAVLGCGCEH